MESRDLRILFVVDAIQGRNGVGTYYQDLVAHLKTRVARAELVAPRLDEPHPCQGASLPMPGDPTQRLFFPRMRELTRLALDMRPHVIVVPGPGIFSLAGFWLARKMRVPVCVTHQTDYDRLVSLYWGPVLARLGSGLLRWLNATLFRGATSVVTVSERMVEQARRIGVRDPRLVGTPLAPAFVDRPVAPLAPEIRSVLYVGRLAAEKNIESFLALAEARPDLRFTIVGDGPQGDLVREYERRLDNLHFAGWCSRDAVMNYLDDSQVLMLPSRVEAFGTAALEAMARGRLVVTSPACGINQWPALARGLFPMDRGESPEQALRRLEATSPASREALADQARAAAVGVNERVLDDWREVLRHTAEQAWSLRPPRPSAAFALLRRSSP